MSTPTHGKQLKLKRGSKRHTFHLLDGQEILATLKLRNPQATSAVAETGQRQMDFTRANVWRKNVHLHNEAKEHIGTMASNWKCEGAVALGGHTYYWLPANRRWTQWIWRNEAGKEILRLTPKHNLLDMEAKVTSQTDLGQEDARQLVLLGWYMLLLHHQDIGSHLLTGLQLRLSHLKRLVFR